MDAVSPGHGKHQIALKMDFLKGPSFYKKLDLSEISNLANLTKLVLMH